ncbi:MAG: Crp/Fnr family transcriptional regulator [Bacteroidia bacterium]|nr:Crp/Fnr family transcriptional regulator [Bacteroidia bacterium]
MESLLNNIARYIQLEDDEKEYFLSLVGEKKVRRKQLLLQEGEVCHHSIFVKSGCLRGYTLDKNGDEHVISFATAGWWIADMYSLITRKPGQLFIESSTEAHLQLLTREHQEKLFEQIPKFERFFRILTENSLVATQQRIIDNLSLGARERYLEFIRKYPSLKDELPQKHIASYIGVTPEFFSKMMRSLPE